MDEASVAGTANVLMASVLAEGKKLYIMLLVNHIFSNYVSFYVKWEQKLKV